MAGNSAAAAGFRAAVLALACGACTTIAPNAVTFEGTSWRATAINGQPIPDQPTGYRLYFKNGRFSGGYGCNSMGAEYRVTGNQLLIGKTEGGQFHTGWIMQTERDCSDRPGGRFEEQALAIMREPMQIRPNGHNSIVLMSGPGTIVLNRLP